jgi:hypothetical protein
LRIWRSAHLRLERLELGVARGGEPDGGLELALVDRLREGGPDAHCDRSVDEPRVLDA